MFVSRSLEGVSGANGDRLEIRFSIRQSKRIRRWRKINISNIARVDKMFKINLFFMVSDLISSIILSILWLDNEFVTMLAIVRLFSPVFVGEIGYLTRLDNLPLNNIISSYHGHPPPHCSIFQKIMIDHPVITPITPWAYAIYNTRALYNFEGLAETILNLNRIFLSFPQQPSPLKTIAN